MVRQPLQFMLMDLIVNRLVMFVVACLARARATDVNFARGLNYERYRHIIGRLPFAQARAQPSQFMLVDLIVNDFVMFVVASLTRALDLHLRRMASTQVLGAGPQASPKEKRTRRDDSGAREDLSEASAR